MSQSTNQPLTTKIYVEGRYNKYSRDLPQTIFYCPECKGHPRRRKKCEHCEGFGKLTKDSVQELIAWVAGKQFGTRKNKFHGSGREDIDVRMLGTGRPFVFELNNAKIHDVDLAELEAEINRRNDGRMAVRNLHYSEKARVVILKESKHAKEYEALVAVEGTFDADKVKAVLEERVTIQQQTPGRVAHRRADLTRERWIEILSVEIADDAPGELDKDGNEIPAGRARIRMRTAHGTYVKEVLSGESGRTEPNVGELLGAPCRCLELDVLGILGEEGDEVEEKVVFQAPFGGGLT
ncbi:MAG: tRNA pseudouridine synthase 10 [Bacteroidia bacterium]|jgi:tRNA pseudouridine synthase 10